MYSINRSSDTPYSLHILLLMIPSATRADDLNAKIGKVVGSVDYRAAAAASRSVAMESVIEIDKEKQQHR